jgi:HEAT repeat protein
MILKGVRINPACPPLGDLDAHKLPQPTEIRHKIREMDKETEGLLARLTGYERKSEEEVIRALVERADEQLIEELEARLGKSQWPVCVGYATVLSRIGGERAKSALIKSLSARKHHVRTAAVNALVAFGDASVAAQLETLLDDPAFESRTAARDAIATLTGKQVKTARGE